MRLSAAQRQQVEVPDRLIAEEQAVALPMQPGDALLMFQHTVHSSLDNTTSDQVRISVDLRYQPPVRRRDARRLRMPALSRVALSIPRACCATLSCERSAGTRCAST